MTAFCKRALIVFALSWWIAPALAQSSLGPVTDPIQPEPELGLPEKAPSQNGAAGGGTVAPRAEAPAAAASTESAWQAECQGEAAARICQATVRGSSGGQVVLVLSLAKTGKGNDVAMQMALPLGFSIERGATVAVGSYTATFPIARCTAQGCLVENNNAAAFLSAIVKAAGERPAPNSTVTIATMDGGPIKLPIPLSGAREALKTAGLEATQ